MQHASRSDDEVRHCARCGRAAMVCTHRWQHRVMGVDTQTWTLDFACRACGAEVTLHPPSRIWGERLFATLMIPAIVPAVYFFASAHTKARAWTDHPVVRGAPAPSRPPGLRDRACGCGGAGRCTAIVARQTRWMSIGRRYEYTCVRCRTAFAVHDGPGVGFSFVAATLLTAAGTLVLAFPPGSAVHAEESNQGFGWVLLGFAAIAWVSAATRIRARLLHPELA